MPLKIADKFVQMYVSPKLIYFTYFKVAKSKKKLSIAQIND